jgi:tetratricopeptide (TPR) repeat protein
LENGKHAVELEPDSASGYGQVASAYAGLNRIEEARATVNTALQRKAATPEFAASLASLDWSEGKEADMEKALQSCSATPEGGLEALLFRFNLAASRGQARQAYEFARQAQEAFDRLHLQGRAEVEAQLAGFEAVAGNSAKAANDATEALRLSKTLSVMGNVATIFAVLGQDQKALALANEIERGHPNNTFAINVTVPLIRAVAALKPTSPGKSDPAKAIDFLNTAALYARADTAVFYVRGIAYAQAKHYAEAQQDFQKVLDLKAHNGPDILFATTELELGRVFQKQGDASKARIAYQNFLAAWKDADSDVPLLHEAKTEYAKLQ